MQYIPFALILIFAAINYHNLSIHIAIEIQAQQKLPQVWRALWRLQGVALQQCVESGRAPTENRPDCARLPVQTGRALPRL